MIKQNIVLLLTIGLVAPVSLWAQTDSAQDAADHEQLRALREALTDAVIKGDVEAQLEFAHENIVTTWQNGQVARGTEGLREFLAEMNGTGERVFRGYTVPPTPDDVTLLYGGDTAVAYGSSVPHYKYLGMEFDLPNRWTATLVKEDGRWKVAAYHVSSNIVDNPVLDLAKRSSYLTGGGGLLLGALLGVLATRAMCRKRS
jgi:ketosteroid isomerase-like protein